MYIYITHTLISKPPIFGSPEPLLMHQHSSFVCFMHINGNRKALFRTPKPFASKGGKPPHNKTPKDHGTCENA
jgi:hypothetical protein